MATMVDPALQADDVMRWLDGVRREMAELQDRLAPLLEEQRRLETREMLLKELLSSFGRRVEPKGIGSTEVGGATAVDLTTTGSVGEYVTARAREILREAGEPLHINAIHARFLERGYTIPGAGRPVNITTHLRNASDIRSPKRGIYGLAEHVGPVARPARKRRSKGKRARTVG